MFGSAPTAGDSPVPKLRAFSSPWPAWSSWALQVSAATKCSQQLQPLSPAFGRDQGSPEQLQTQHLGTQRHNSSFLMHKEHFSALHISLNPNSQQRNLGFSTQVKPRAGVQHQPELLTPSQDLELVAGSGLKLWNYLGKLHFGSSVTSRLYFYLTLTKSVACPQLLLHVRILSSINIYFLNPILGQGTSPES